MIHPTIPWTLLVWIFAMASAFAQTPQLGDLDGDRVAIVRDIALMVEHPQGTAPHWDHQSRNMDG